MAKELCYWCAEEVANKSFRKYIGLDGNGKAIYKFFCDDVCIECFEYEIEVENGGEADDKIKTEGKKTKNGNKTKQCSTCGWGGKAKEFPCKVSVDANRGNNSGKKYYFCDKGCLETFIKKVADEEVDI